MADGKPHHIGTLSPEMALLGLLYRKPKHGYDLHRKVITDLGEVWHLSQSQAYSILKRLEARGDISEQGCQRFLKWLETPSGGSTRAIRMEFTTRLYFMKMYFPRKILHAFDQQRVEAKTHIQRLEKTLEELPDDQVYNRMSVEMRLKQLNLVLEWLDDSQKYFEKK